MFVLAPTIGVLVLSFYDWNLLSDGRFVGLDNFAGSRHDKRLLGRVRVDRLHGIGHPRASTSLVGLLLAVLLETRMPRLLRGIFRLSFLFPFVVSATAVALIWRFLLNKDLGAGQLPAGDGCISTGSTGSAHRRSPRSR